MKQVPGTDIWVPDSDTHFFGKDKKGNRVAENYQQRQVKMALEGTPRRVAVDVGAHVGLITLQLAQHFREVISFTPPGETYDCLVRNTKHLKNVKTVPCAVGEIEKMVRMEPCGENSGDVQVVSAEFNSDPNGNVLMVTLDSCDFITRCDLLKLDVQGYEYRVLLGAKETLMAFTPTVWLEDEPDGKLRHHFDKPGTARLHLERAGATCVAEIGSDYVYKFGPDGAWPYTKYAERGDYHWRAYQSGKNCRYVDPVCAYVNSLDLKSYVLEIGCGDGIYAGHIKNCIGIDSNSKAVELAKMHGVEAYHQSAFAYPFESMDRNHIGAVCMFDAFEHLPKQSLLLKRIQHATRNLIILNPDPNGSAWHVREFAHQDLIAFCLKHGWKLKHRIDLPAAKALLHFVPAGETTEILDSNP